MGDRARVSCLALSLFSDYLRERLELTDRDIDRIYEGLPYSRDFLADRLNWIDYDTFLEIERRVARVVGGSEGFFEIGRAATLPNSFRFMGTILRSMFGPLRLYQRLVQLVPRFLFPFLTIDIRQLGPRTLEARYHFHPTCPPSDYFVETTRGILACVPEVFARPPANVRVERRETHRVVYVVEVVAWLSPLQRVTDGLRSLRHRLRLMWRAVGAAVHELEEANELLLEKVEALTEAKRSLDQRVRDLSMLNALARGTAAHLDLRRVVRAAARVLSEERGGRPAVVMVREAPDALPVVAAVAGMSVVERRRLERLVRFAGLLDPVEEADVAAEFAVDGARWLGVHLRAGEQRVGLVLLQLGREERIDTETAGALGHQLGLAIQNARSYRLVEDLRDHLEIRVEERTAELEEARARLEDTVARLEEADRAKQAFFTNVSHELKTPLTLILAPLGRLEEAIQAGDRERAEELLGAIRRNAVQLRALVEEILDFSRLDSGRLRLDRQPVDLAALAQDVVHTLRPLAERRRIAVDCRTPGEGVAAEVDPRLVRRVLVNLVGNAIKYVGEGDRVEVSVRALGPEVEIVVADTGPGIPEEEVERIFERFHRCWNHAGRQVEGSGIGLAMAREIVELHGGRIELHSRLGVGSTFVVRLPRGDVAGEVPAPPPPAEDPASSPLPALLAAEEAPDAEDTVEPDPLRKTVLLVEDNPEMRAFLAHTLARRFNVLVASDGLDGLERVREGAPDLVLSDVAMPRMDGIEMCRRLKSDPATRALPVILVSARPGEGAPIEGFEAGADDYLVKPFSTAELLARVEVHLRVRDLTLALVRAERQATIGTLAAGIAHEILNPVNVVVNAAGLLRATVDGAETAEEVRAGGGRVLELIEDSAHRIQRVVESVLSLARGGAAHLERVHARLRPRVDAVLDLLGSRARRAGVRLEVRVPEDLSLECYADLLDQVVMNLVINAIDALEGRGGGEVVVWAERRDGEVVLGVRDDGPGVPPELRERIFTAFFTTKAPGRGTGIGLAMCREIAELHGGSLTLAQRSRGAEFVVRIPDATGRGGEPEHGRDRGGSKGGEAGPGELVA